MIYKLSYQNTSLSGKLRLSGSKSESNRALIINYLSGSGLGIQNLSTSDDTQTLVRILTEMNQKQELDVGHAGTAMRFLTALLSITPGERILKGSKRMHERPVKVLVEALRNLGADITYLGQEGYPPLKINGKSLKGGKINVRGDISSQYLSALMMIAPYLKGGLKINVKEDLVSRPYVDMTSAIMSHFGARLVVSNHEIVVEEWKYHTHPFTVESDWSSASYWYEAAAFCATVDLEIDGLKPSKSLQADAVLTNIYEQLGVQTSSTSSGIRLTKKTAKMHFQEYNFSACPDIAQTLACTAVMLENEVLLTGLKTLKIKETDRIEALKIELEKLGVLSETGKDFICIKKSKNLCTGTISTYSDHRMAMAFAMLVFYMQEIAIEMPEVVSKSYPEFWQHLHNVGVDIEKK